MKEILVKFDEAKRLAQKAISILEKKENALDEKEKAIALAEGEVKKKEAELRIREKAVIGADRILKSQAELDRANSEVKATLNNLENQVKQRRAEYVKKRNELESRERTVATKEKELREGFARLGEEKETYRKKIVEEISKKLLKK